MDQLEDKPFQMKKEYHLKENPVFQNTCLCDDIYDDGIRLSSLHFHEFIEISIVVSGCGIHRIWNEAVECKKGDVYIMKAGVPHGYFARDEQNQPVVSNLLFDPMDLFSDELADSDSQRFCYGIFRENFSVAHIALKPRQLETIEAIYGAVEKEISDKETEWLEAVKAELTRFLIMVSRLMEKKASISMPVKSKEQVLVSNTAKYVMDHYADSSLTLERIAATLYVSKSYLSKMFRRVTGEYFAEYLRNVRLKQACSLLRSTKLTNEQIVHYCGLKDVPAFYRLFKAQYNMTPGQYRDMAER